MDNNVHSTAEVSFHHEPAANTRRIWRIFWILLGLTIIELALGFGIHAIDMPNWVALFLKGVIVILTLAKAYYITSYFMHLGDEIRNMIMTVVVPLMLFIWFIAAFLWDGNAYKTLKNTYDPYYKETTLDRNVKPADTTRHTLD